MGISLTLSELKQYFKTWHENNFKDLHEVPVINIIDSYLRANGYLDKINSVTNIEATVVNFAKYLSKCIDGQSNLGNSSTISAAISEVANKSSRLSSINLQSLFSLINQTDAKIDIEVGHINDTIDDLRASLGIKPKQLMVQNIPVNGETDLNNYRVPGLYKSESSSITSGLSHTPDGAKSSAFTLIVVPYITHSETGEVHSVRQILLSGGSSSEGNRIYMRNYQHSSNTPWGKSENSGWYELYGDHNLKPLQMKIEWSDNSPSTTYTILQK